MSVTFKCNKTGNTVTFKSQYDIESMRQHPEYSEVLPEKEQVFPTEEQVKRVGRPRKEQQE